MSLLISSCTASALARRRIDYPGPSQVSRWVESGLNNSRVGREVWQELGLRVSRLKAPGAAGKPAPNLCERWVASVQGPARGAWPPGLWSKC